MCGSKYFRFYNEKCFNLITFIARDELKYSLKALKEEGYRIIASDTDSAMYSSKENLTPFLNDKLVEWGLKNYNKNVSVRFEYEGFFTKVFFDKMCRYYGYIQTKKGLKLEIKGLEVKRSNSTKYQAEFQKNLLEKFLDKEDNDDIIEWIWKEKNRIKTLPLEQIAFPVKISEREYANDPIQIRAIRNTQMLKPEFNIEKGDLFYYVKVKSLGKDINGKEIDVIAFDKSIDLNYIPNIDWNEMVEKNITSKAENLFETVDKNYIPALRHKTL